MASAECILHKVTSHGGGRQSRPICRVLYELTLLNSQCTQPAQLIESAVLYIKVELCKVSPANLLEGFGVSAVIAPQLSIMHIVYFNEI